MELDPTMHWGAIICQCICTDKEYFIALSCLQGNHRAFWHFKLLKRLNQSENILPSKPWAKNVLLCPSQVRFWALNVAKTPKKTPICEVWCLLCVQRNQCCHQYWKFPCRKIIPEVMRTLKFCLFRKISLSYNWKWPLSWQRPPFSSVS